MANPNLQLYSPTPRVTLRLTRRARILGSLVLAALALAGMPTSHAQTSTAASPLSDADSAVVQARDVFGSRDKNQAARLAQLQQAVAGHPLAAWVDYWALRSRLGEAQQPELTAFSKRWPSTYVEDRLRNDWLLELGRRQDWDNFRTERALFRMNDDRDVQCYTLLLQHRDGLDVRDAARSAWHSQRSASDGCTLMGQTLVRAKVLSQADAWQEMRFSAESNRKSAALAAAEVISPALEKMVASLWANPTRFLARRLSTGTLRAHDLDLLAVIRGAASDPEATADLIEKRVGTRFSAEQLATAWAHVAKNAAIKHDPDAAEYARRAWQVWDRAHKAGVQPPWSEDVLSWHVRAGLRESGNNNQRWRLVLRAIDAMPDSALQAASSRPQGWSAALRPDDRDGTWVYWKARGTLALAPSGLRGDEQRNAAQAWLTALSAHPGFYGQLAGADLKLPFSLPAALAPLTEAERSPVSALPGLNRALLLFKLGLRSEAVREWNYTLIGMNTRQLLAAAQLACDNAVWDRCINTSERTDGDIDIVQRFPLPLRGHLVDAATSENLEPAVLFGLIRQESRFIMDARSHVGASGLMQLMPATARWTAKKIGLDYKRDMINDPEVNLRLGSAYLRRLLDDFDGSLALAAAAYNAGPGRSRRWREGPVLESAAWVETIPFNETRDYVKKVLSNTVTYNALLGEPLKTLPARLGPTIGPRAPGAREPDEELP